MYKVEQCYKHCEYCTKYSISTTNISHLLWCCFACLACLTLAAVTFDYYRRHGAPFYCLKHQCIKKAICYPQCRLAPSIPDLSGERVVLHLDLSLQRIFKCTTAFPIDGSSVLLKATTHYEQLHYACKEFCFVFVLFNETWYR